MSAPDNTDFEAIFRLPDPWGFESLWYEARKREILLASLPDRRYGRAFEPACANGLLTEALARRCTALVAMDPIPRAIELARARLATHPHVSLEVGELPRDWPDGIFDLIVLSEFAYYLPLAAWQRLAQRAAASLSPQGVIVACHWLRPFRGRQLSPREAHRCIGRQPGLHRQARHLEPDFLLEVWSRDARPLRSREEAPT